MIAHRKLTARQRIERLVQLRGLRARKVSRVRHAVDLPLQQSLGGASRYEREGLGEHQRKWGRQQAVVQAHDARGGVLLDAEHRTDARPRGGAVLDGFRPEQQPCRDQCRIQRPGRQRHAHRLRVRQEGKVFKERGAPGVAVAIRAQQFRVVTLKRGLHRLGKLGASIQGIGQIRRLRGSPGAGQRACDQAGRSPRSGPVHQCDIQLVGHHALARKPLRIAVTELRGKARAVRGRELRSHGPANQMGPERKIGSGEVAPQHIQTLVPGVELLIVRALETRPAQAQPLQIVTGRGADDGR